MKNRRNFLKIASASTLALCVNPAISFASSNKKDENKYELSKGEQALTGERFGLVIDTRKLTEEISENIKEICHKTHNVPNHTNKRHEIKWVWSEEYAHAFPDMENDLLNERLKETPFPCNV